MSEMSHFSTVANTCYCPYILEFWVTYVSDNDTDHIAMFYCNLNYFFWLWNITFLVPFCWNIDVVLLMFSPKAY